MITCRVLYLLVRFVSYPPKFILEAPPKSHPFIRRVYWNTYFLVRIPRLFCVRGIFKIFVDKNCRICHLYWYFHLSICSKTRQRDLHPKTLIEMWITCLDPVSANSEKCVGSQWAVRVGQRLQSRFGERGAARKLGLVQIIVEASSIRGGFSNTDPCQLVSGWRCRCDLRDYREWLSIQTAGYKLNLGRWLLVTCFSSVKNHNVSGLIFFEVSPHMPKKSLYHP